MVGKVEDRQKRVYITPGYYTETAACTTTALIASFVPYLIATMIIIGN